MKIMEFFKLLLEYIEVLIWPAVVIYILKLFKNQIGDFFSRVEKADLPGGISLQAFQGEINVGKELSAEVKEEKTSKTKELGAPTIPLNEANARMLNLGLAPSPSGLDLSEYRLLAQRDPNLALAGIRMEVEIMVKNLAKGFGLPSDGRHSTSLTARMLNEKGNLTNSQANLISTVMKLCNSAIHGQKVTKKQAEDILDIIEILKDDYVSWLGWGFPNQ